MFNQKESCVTELQINKVVLNKKVTEMQPPWIMENSSHVLKTAVALAKYQKLQAFKAVSGEKNIFYEMYGNLKVYIYSCQDFIQRKNTTLCMAFM